MAKSLIYTEPALIDHRPQTDPEPENLIPLTHIPEEIGGFTVFSAAAQRVVMRLVPPRAKQDERRVEIVWHSINPRENLVLEFVKGGQVWEIVTILRFYWLCDALAYYGAVVGYPTVQEFLSASADFGYLERADYDRLRAACALEGLSRSLRVII